RSAAVFFYSPIGRACIPDSISPANSGSPQADAYAGFNKVYRPDRKPGVITEAGCWAHARRKLFELADIVSKARKGKPTTISPFARWTPSSCWNVPSTGRYFCLPLSEDGGRFATDICLARDSKANLLVHYHVKIMLIFASLNANAGHGPL